jgi:hypothetical protein
MIKKKNQTCIRANVGSKAVKNIKKTRALLALRGKDMTQEQAIEYMLINFTVK